MSCHQESPWSPAAFFVASTRLSGLSRGVGNHSGSLELILSDVGEESFEVPPPFHDSGVGDGLPESFGLLQLQGNGSRDCPKEMREPLFGFGPNGQMNMG